MFFQMTQIMTIMEDFLSMQGYQYLRLDGSTKSDDRSDLLKKFNSPESQCFVFLLSTRAGGLGLNLQTADTVIIFDSDWNPHQDLQAQDRAHRIGQTKEVRIFRLITIDSVEEYILERAQHKLNLDGKVIQAGKFDHKSTNEERDAMLRAIMEREAEKNDVEEIYGDEELNEIIARSEADLEIFRKIDQEREQLEIKRAKTVGSRQSRLIDASELPKVYLVDEEVVDEVQDEAFADVRSSRLKRDISYNENISDDKWLAQLERGETDNNASPSSIPTSTSMSSTPRKAKTARVHDRQADFSNSESESAGGSLEYPRLKFKIPRKESQERPHSAGEDSYGLDHTTRLSIMRSVFDAVENCVEMETNRYRSDLFLELPEKSLYPDYYTLIEKPVCLSMIEKQLERFKTIKEFMSILDLMFNNAMKYNVEGSQVYEDAQVMRQLALDKLAELLEAEGRFGEDAEKTASATDARQTDGSYEPDSESEQSM